MERKTDAPTRNQLQRLIQERDQLNLEIEALRNKVAGLEIAIAVVSDEPKQPSLDIPKVRVSETIVSLLRDAGPTGLKPKDAIDLAAQHGISLNRGSVYALLNRMERTGVVVHEGAHYKLAEFAHR